MRYFRSLTVLLLLAACASPIGPSSTIDGTWSADRSVPGSGLSLTLSASGASAENGAVTGAGQYRIEAGRSGTLRVSGTYSGPQLSLTLSFDYGPIASYTGSLQSPTRMVGQVQYLNPSLPATELDFTK
jgi:hypothetical protein